MDPRAETCAALEASRAASPDQQAFEALLELRHSGDFSGVDAALAGLEPARAAELLELTESFFFAWGDVPVETHLALIERQETVQRREPYRLIWKRREHPALWEALQASVASPPPDRHQRAIEAAEAATDEAAAMAAVELAGGSPLEGDGAVETRALAGVLRVLTNTSTEGAEPVRRIVGMLQKLGKSKKARQARAPGIQRAADVALEAGWLETAEALASDDATWVGIALAWRARGELAAEEAALARVGSFGGFRAAYPEGAEVLRSMMRGRASRHVSLKTEIAVRLAAGVPIRQIAEFVAGTATDRVTQGEFLAEHAPDLLEKVGQGRIPERYLGVLATHHPELAAPRVEEAKASWVPSHFDDLVAVPFRDEALQQRMVDRWLALDRRGRDYCLTSGIRTALHVGEIELAAEWARLYLAPEDALEPLEVSAADGALFVTSWAGRGEPLEDEDAALKAAGRDVERILEVARRVRDPKVAKKVYTRAKGAPANHRHEQKHRVALECALRADRIEAAIEHADQLAHRKCGDGLPMLAPWLAQRPGSWSLDVVEDAVNTAFRLHPQWASEPLLSGLPDLIVAVEPADRDALIAIVEEQAEDLYWRPGDPAHVHLGLAVGRALVGEDSSEQVMAALEEAREGIYVARAAFVRALARLVEPGGEPLTPVALAPAVEAAMGLASRGSLPAFHRLAHALWHLGREDLLVEAIVEGEGRANQGELRERVVRVGGARFSHDPVEAVRSVWRDGFRSPALAAEQGAALGVALERVGDPRAAEVFAIREVAAARRALTPPS